MSKKRYHSMWIILVPFLLFVSSGTTGKVIYVDDDGPADFNNIQDAVEDANDGDTVLVADGTYTGPGNRDIDFLGKAITVRSENGAENCTVGNGGYGFIFQNGEDSNSILAGFTIERCYERMGGGIHCNSSSPLIESCIITNCENGIFNVASEPTIERCTFRGNSCYNGGGMYNVDSSPKLNHCTFLDNWALSDCEGGGEGGAIYNYHSDLVLTNCVFIGNGTYMTCLMCPWPPLCIGPGIGGGMYNELSNVKLINCTFADNIGGALACDSWPRSPSYVELVNCILSSSITGDGRFVPEQIDSYDGSVIMISNSDIQGGPQSVFDPCNALIWGEGNIDIDPCFVSLGYWEDPCDMSSLPWDDIYIPGDYHLKSQAGRYDPVAQSWLYDDVTSPCIDVGNPLSPIGLETFPNGGVVNMGAYGGTAEASKSYFGQLPCETAMSGDINGDCLVDGKDLLILSRHWLRGGLEVPRSKYPCEWCDDPSHYDSVLMPFCYSECERCPGRSAGDLDDDCCVDHADFAALASNWGEDNNP